MLAWMPQGEFIAGGSTGSPRTVTLTVLRLDPPSGAAIVRVRALAGTILLLKKTGK